MSPHVDAVLTYCEGFRLDDLPEEARNLLDLVFSFVMVSFPVEVWNTPRIPDVGDATLARVVSPRTEEWRSEMASFPKPAEGSWTEHYTELGTGPVSYADSISPEFYEGEREAIFGRAWLNVGRVEQLPRNGSYFTKEIVVANTSIVVVRGARKSARSTTSPSPGQQAGLERLPARRRGDLPSSPASTTGGVRPRRRVHFVQQESEFFDLDKADYGLVPVHCDVWPGSSSLTSSANHDKHCASSSGRWSPRSRATRSTR